MPAHRAAAARRGDDDPRRGRTSRTASSRSSDLPEFSAHLPNGHIVPALIAGNTIVFKPSEKTPAVGEFLTGLYWEAGIPEGVVRCVQGGPETGKALAGGRAGRPLFTGSARAGLALNRQFAAAKDPGARDGRQQSARGLGREGPSRRRDDRQCSRPI